MNTIHVGMGGWELHPFNLHFYPPKPKKGFRKLVYYSQFFDTIEVNATFYNTNFTRVHVQCWIDDVAVNRNFIFTVKLFQGFTHTFNVSADDVRSTWNMLDQLSAENKFGGLLIQFPYSFTNRPETREHLFRLSKVFKQYRMFLEVRHKSWNTPSMYNFFQENKFHLVNVDLPGIKDHIPFNQLAWDGSAYFRMMGRNARSWVNPWRLEEDGKHMVSDRYNYLYADEELEELIAFIENVKNSASNIFVVFHNDPNANSLFNGFRLRHLLQPKNRLLIPHTMIKTFPSLKEISSSVNVLHPLFAEQSS